MNAFACYDPTQKKIFGCDEGSWTWWHEKGHEHNHLSGISAVISVYYTLLLHATIGMALVGQINNDFTFYAIILFVCMMALVLIEELLAWMYAIKHKPKNGQV